MIIRLILLTTLFAAIAAADAPAPAPAPAPLPPCANFPKELIAACVEHVKKTFTAEEFLNDKMTEYAMGQGVLRSLQLEQAKQQIEVVKLQLENERASREREDNLRTTFLWGGVLLPLLVGVAYCIYFLLNSGDMNFGSTQIPFRVAGIGALALTMLFATAFREQIFGPHLAAAVPTPTGAPAAPSSPAPDSKDKPDKGDAKAAEKSPEAAPKK